MPESEMADIQCDHCGRDVPGNRWVCPYCGSALNPKLDEQHDYSEPIPPDGPFRHAIRIHRRSAEDDFEPMRASRWPSIYLILELIAVAVVLIIFIVLARQWFGRIQEESPIPDANGTSFQSETSSSLAREMAGAPRSAPTPGASPTPFVLILPTPTGDDTLPPVTQEALPGDGVLQ